MFGGYVHSSFLGTDAWELDYVAGFDAECGVISDDEATIEAPHAGPMPDGVWLATPFYVLSLYM